MGKIIRWLVSVLLKPKPFDGEMAIEKRFFGTVESVVHSPDGTKTYMKGHKYPFNGLLEKEVVADLDIAKKFLPVQIDIAEKALRKHIVARKEHQWCRSVREIRRVFNLLIEREETGIKTMWEKMRDVISITMEMDDAYRFRVQDMLSEINPREFDFDDNDKYWSSKKPYKFAEKNRYKPKQ